MSNEVNFYFKKVKNLDKNKIKNLTSGKPSFFKDSWLYEIPKLDEQIIVFINELGIVQLNFYERYNEEFIKEIIGLTKKIYKILKIVGHGRNENEGDGEELDDFYPKSFEEISTIWSATLLSPLEVQKYGREKLLKAPCELIEEWEDGAIFMVIHKDKFSSTYEERKKLREYLGENVKK